MKDAVLRKVRESAEVSERFFVDNAAEIDTCARVLAQRFKAGGRLLVMGNGGSACDAAHIAVEFIHPIVEKRRALPAMALSSDTAILTAIGNDSDFSSVFERQLDLYAQPSDAALGISTSGSSANVCRALKRARSTNLLTIGFTGRDGGRMRDVCEHCFVVPSWSIHRIQETHVILLHVLWDLVHVSLGEDDVL